MQRNGPPELTSRLVFRLRFETALWDSVSARTFARSSDIIYGYDCAIMFFLFCLASG